MPLQAKAIVRSEGLIQRKIPVTPLGNQARNIPVRSSIPQPIAPPPTGRASKLQNF